jgi:putative PEP-CTERM system TPR-repeat lipoprotein
MPITKILLFLILSFVSTFHVSAQTSKELLTLAEMALQHKEYSSALIHLKNAARQDPQNKTIHLKLAQLFIITGQGVQAEVEVSKAKHFGASPAEIAVLSAKAKLLQGKFEELSENIDLLDLPQQEIARLRAIQGHSFYEQRKFLQARQMFQRAIRLAPDKLEVKLAQARLYQLEGKIDEQKALVKLLLDKYPDNAEVLLVAGNFYRGQADYSKALELFQLAGKIQPSNVNVWFGIVRSYIGMKKYNEAKIEIQKVLTSYPEHQVANYLLSVIAFEEGDFNRARAAIEIVLKGEKRKYEALKLLSSIQFQQKEYTEAEKNLKKYIKHHPGDINAQKTLASIYLKRKQGVLALDILNKIEAPQDPYIYSMIATAYIQTGNKKQSQLYFKKSQQLSPNNRTILRHIQKTKLEAGETLDIDFTDTSYENFIDEGYIPILNFLRKEEYKRAQNVIRGYMKKMPESALLYYLLGSSFLYQGQDDQASQNFKRAIKLDPDLIEPHIYLAKLYQKLGEERNAEREYREVLRIQKTNDQAMVALAGIALRKGNETEMLKWLNKSRRLNSASLASREVLEKNYREKGELKKALEIAYEMVRIQPQNVSLLLKLANNQKSVNRVDLAIKTFQQIVELIPEQSSAWFGLGRLQYLNGSIKASSKSFNKVLELDNNNLAAKVILTQIDIKTGQLRSALKRANDIKKTHPESPAGFDMAGDIYIAMNQPGSAIEQYNQSVKLNYASDTYLKLFSAYNRNNQSSKGFEKLKEWVQRHPEDLALKEALAITYQRKGRLQKSLQLYQQILQTVRDNDRILNRAALVALQLKNPMSMEYADLAMSLDPKSAKNKDTFGWILFNNNNDSAKAEKLLQEAVNASPSNPDFRYHLAVLLANKGDKVGALKNLYLTMGTESEFENKTEARKLLARLKK